MSDTTASNSSIPATQLVPYMALAAFAEQVFLAAGSTAAYARITVRNLLLADLRGVDSHGVARLSGYLRLVEAGRIDLRTAGGPIHQTPSTTTWDGQRGMGHVVAQKAMEHAINLADTAGTGWVAVKNSNHYGLAGTYAMMAAKRGMIGISLTNASPLVAPTYGLDRMLGTNPIAVAIPTMTQPTFVLDMATTTAANGKLEVLQRKGLPTPEGWIQDAEGQITTDASGVQQGGALRPLGGNPAGASHKGYGLGSVVDILSGVLSGAGYGPWVPPFVSFLPLPALPVGQGLGHFLGAMRVDAFMPQSEFLSRMDHWISSMRGTKAIDWHKVMIPGDQERICHDQRMKEGIPLLPAVVEDLRKIGAQFGVSTGF